MNSRTVAVVSTIALLIVVFWAFLGRSRNVEDRRSLVVLSGKHAALKRERDGLAKEVGALKRQVGELPFRQAAPVIPRIPTAEDNSDGTIERVGQLKRTLFLHPQFGLPEFDLLNDDDWLEVAKGMKKDSETEARKAFDLLRQTAKQRFLLELRAAEHSYRAKHGHAATDPQFLKPHFPNPAHACVLDRYEPCSGEELFGRRDFYFRERTAADEWYDTRIWVSAGGIGLERVGLSCDVDTAVQKYRTQHGSAPRDALELRPYLNTPIEEKVLREIFRHGGF